jgi:hypothetical protein
MPPNRVAAAALVLHPSDNVAVLKQPAKPGDEVKAGEQLLAVKEPIGAGHKIALVDIPEGCPVLKYGQNIGWARATIATGEHVHVHNLSIKAATRDIDFCSDVRFPQSMIPVRCSISLAMPGPVGLSGHATMLRSSPA